MGACYTFYDATAAATGVWPHGMAPIPCPHTGDLPLFEGQINTHFMPLGDYRIVLVPRGGTPAHEGNILRGDLNCNGGWNPWYAKPANHVNGDEIKFNLVN